MFMGTPPKPADPSEVFTRMRREALSGEDEDTGWVEFGADPSFTPTESPAPLTEADWRQVAKANPSFPEDTPREAILRMRKKLGPESFLREGLGIWDEDGGGALPGRIWRGLADASAERGSDPVFGIDVDQDRQLWIAVAWSRNDGAQLMLSNEGRPLPAHQVVDECSRLSKEWNARVICPPAFHEDLERAGVKAVKATSVDFTAACGALLDAVRAGGVHHGNQAMLNGAVKAAKWRGAGVDGSRAFQLKDSPEVGPLAAATRALHGWNQFKGANYDPLQSVY